MTPEPIAATRCFSEDLQLQFAKLSGDWNPMHVDAVAARRTQPGAPVVHGVHALLWALDTMAGQIPSFRLIRRIKTDFFKWIYVDSTVRLMIISTIETEIRAQLIVGDIVTANIVVTLGSSTLAQAFTSSSRFLSPEATTSANELEFCEMASQAGVLEDQPPLEEVAIFFPHLSAILQPQRVASLIAISRLVGMICPGLYSIISALNISIETDTEMDGTLRYSVKSTVERYRIVRLEVEGSGIAGIVETFARFPPALQAPMDIVAGQVESSEFSGAHVLVIGGSRGLGELTAKIIAAGGGEVTITYKAGKDDALGVAQEIQQSGGVCRAMYYDALQPSGQQLRGLVSPVTHAYYYATGQIFRPKKGLFAPDVYQQFSRFYVDGFVDFCQSLSASGRDDISVFYPSSVAVSDRPVDMTEYAMAKAAGEVLCDDINRYLPRVRVVVRRLPRLPTDQTLSVIPVRSFDPLETILPIIREVQRNTKYGYNET